MKIKKLQNNEYIHRGGMDGLILCTGNTFHFLGYRVKAEIRTFELEIRDHWESEGKEHYGWY